MPRKRKAQGLEGLLGLSRGQLGSVASAFLQSAVAAPQRRLLDQLGEWASHFSKSALEKWPHIGIDEQQCVMDGCDSEAVLQCMACGAPVCLAHIHLSFRAEGICDQCVRYVTAERRAAGSAARAASREDVRAAYRTLGLKQNASWARVQRVHRELAYKYHPDRKRTAPQQELCEARLKRINAAFETLRVHYERKAA